MLMLIDVWQTLLHTKHNIMVKRVLGNKLDYGVGEFNCIRLGNRKYCLCVGIRFQFEELYVRKEE